MILISIHFIGRVNSNSAIVSGHVVDFLTELLVISVIVEHDLVSSGYLKCYARRTNRSRRRG